MALRYEDVTARGAVVVPFPRAGRSPRGHSRTVVRRRRTLVGIVGALFVVGFLFATGPSGSVPAAPSGSPRVVHLQPGQTLWEVAERHAPEGIDPRAYVDLVLRANDLEGRTPVAGMRLELPR